VKALNKDTIAKLLGHYWETPVDHLAQILANPLTPAGQAAVARAFVHASVGDLDALKFILERAIGKVPDKLETKATIEVLPTREEAILTLTKEDYAVLPPAEVKVDDLD
jgi:hypothetical protein